MSSMVMVFAFVPPPVNEYTPHPLRPKASVRTAAAFQSLFKVILLYFAVERTLRYPEVSRGVLALVVVLAQRAYNQLPFFRFDRQSIVVFCFMCDILDIFLFFSVRMNLQHNWFRYTLSSFVLNAIEQLRVILHELTALSLVVIDVQHQFLQIHHVALHVEEHLIENVTLTDGFLFSSC